MTIRFRPPGLNLRQRDAPRQSAQVAMSFAIAMCTFSHFAASLRANSRRGVAIASTTAARCFVTLSRHGNLDYEMESQKWRCPDNKSGGERRTTATRSVKQGSAGKLRFQRNLNEGMRAHVLILRAPLCEQYSPSSMFTVVVKIVSGLYHAYRESVLTLSLRQLMIGRC